MKTPGAISVTGGLSGKETISRAVFFAIISFALIVGTICTVYTIRWSQKPFPGFLVNQRMVYGVVGQYHWTGTHAGLKYPDKILKADDMEVFSPKDLEKILSRKRPGDEVTYTIDRNGKIFDVAIATMRFSTTDLFVIFGSYLIVSIFYLLIGVVVFVLKPGTRVSWIFFCACVLMSLSYSVAFDMVSTHLGFLRLSLFVDAFIPAVAIHFSMFFPEEKHFVQKYKMLQLVPYIVSLSVMVAIQAFYPAPFSISVYSMSMPLLNIAAIGALLGSVFYSFVKKTSAIARQRAKVVFLGAALAFPLPIIIELFFYLDITISDFKLLKNYLVFPIMIFPASVAYAIAKHNLFDVDVYIKRTVGYVMMTVIVAVAYIVLEVSVGSYILKPLFGTYSKKVYSIVFAFVVVFCFEPLQHKVKNFVDKLFYRKKFDYKDTVLSVSNALTSVLNLDEIIKRILNTARKEMFIDTAGVILLETQKNACQTLFIGEKDVNPGAEEKDNRAGDLCISYDDPLVSLISREKKLITMYDIEENPYYAGIREEGMARFSALGTSIAIPLLYKDSVTGILALGNKKSGQFYTREDIHLLETLANQGAIAIENAKMAEQMMKDQTVKTNLARYLSPQIVDQIVSRDVQVNLGGDRKVVTVLFSDIRNFTTISETMPADRLVAILNEYFTEMAAIIFEHQGSLDKYIGDAIVAVFGSLIPLENPSVNAVKASVAMMKKLPELNRKWAEQYNFEMSIGIGVNTGEVFLGNIGSPERMEFTVIGDTVNVASRFSGLAKPGQVLVTRTTIDKLDNEMVQYNELPQTPVKGKAGTMEVFEILY